MVFAFLPSVSSFASPLVGMGVVFLQPFETAGMAGRATPVAATPLLLASFTRYEQAPRTWSFEPQLGVFLPKSNSDSELALGGLATANLGFRANPRMVVLAGGGVWMSALLSNAHGVERSGSFVTASGTALAWLFLLNAGLAYWLDEKIRIEAQSCVVRLLNNDARRFRILFGVSYAL